MLLNAIYEGDFCGFSYGIRPGRGPHDALDALSTAIKIRKVNWILDADIQNFFVKCLSPTPFMVRDRLPFLEDLSDQQLKDITRPVRAYRVRDAVVAAMTRYLDTNSRFRSAVPVCASVSASIGSALYRPACSNR
jgi:RNA-directed DNA polymerase